ncbi:MAG: hypothetical protein JNL75_11135 [Chitinophagales bacterium]|nr:hypothetical protein [Chitinophagales bacterium]
MHAKILGFFLLAAFNLNAQNCKKYILTSEYEEIKKESNKVISNMASSFLASSNRHFVESIIAQKYTTSSYIIWVNNNKAKIQQIGENSVSAIPIVKTDTNKLFFSNSIENGYIAIDLNYMIAYDYPSLYKFKLTVSECEF